MYVGSTAYPLGEFFAFDAASGKLRWHVTVDGPISYTAAVANGAVHVSTWYSAYAFDAASGAQLWHTDNYAVTTPAVANGLVYYGGNGGALYAYDAASGVLRWTAFTPGAHPASDPTVANGVVYLAKDGHEVSAYDAASGAVLWIWKGQFPNNAPTVVNGVVYVGGQDRLVAFHLPPATRSAMRPLVAPRSR